MKGSRNVTCVVCPMGCDISVEFCEDGSLEVKGNRCDRGFEYAVSEVKNPVRVLTTTMRLLNGKIEVLPVKTDRPVPKDKIPGLMKIINEKHACSPIKCGDILIENIAGTGANIISTRNA